MGKGLDSSRWARALASSPMTARKFVANIVLPLKVQSRLDLQAALSHRIRKIYEKKGCGAVEADALLRPDCQPVSQPRLPLAIHWTGRAVRTYRQ